MTVAYHLWLNGEAQGPFALDQVRAMWMAGQITRKDLFSRSGGQEWHYLSEILTELQPPPPEPKTVVAPNANADLVEVLRKIEKAQAETSKSAGFLSTTLKLVLLIIGLFIVGVVGILILLQLGQAQRGTFQTIPEISSSSSETTENQ